MGSFLFNPIGTAGDIHPHVVIAKELQSRGHRVRLLATPNNRPLAEAEGIDFLPLGEPLSTSELANDPRLKRPYSAWKAAMQWAALGMMESVFQQIRELSRSESLTVIAPVWSLGARIARETLPIRLIQPILNPCLLRSAEKPALLPMLPMPSWTPIWFKRWQYRIADRFVLDPILAPRLNQFREQLGLRPVKRVMHRWWFSPDMVLGLFSDTFAPKPTDWPTDIELVGHTLWDPDGDTQEVDQAIEFLKLNSGAIAVVPGSAGPNNAELLPLILKACCSIGRPVLVLSRLQHPELEGQPGRFLHCRYAPLSTILPHCSLVIHSACMGTSCQTLAAGLPHISIPTVNDQFDNARRLHRMGVSATIRQGQLTAQSLAKAIEQRLATSVVRQCKLLGVTHRQSSVSIVCDRLETFGTESNSLSFSFRKALKSKASIG